MAAEINSFLSAKAEKQIKEYEKSITDLVVKMGGLADSANKLEQQQKKQSTTQKDLDNQTKAYNNLLSQLNATSGKLQVAESGLNKELIKQKQNLANAQKEIKQQIKLEQSEEGSINRLRDANARLRKERDDLSTSTVYGRQRINELNAEIESNTKIINENISIQEKARENVGNYEESIRSALDAQEAFSGGAGNIIQNFISISQQEGGIKSFFKSAVAGFGNITKAAWKFVLTPVGAIIAAIVAVIALLTKALSRNQGFLDKFNEVMSGLSAVLDNVIGRVYNLVTAIAKLYWNAAKGDIEGMKAAVDQAGKSFDNLGESITNAFTEGAAIEKMRQDLRKLTIETTTALETLQQEADLQQAIADDATRSFAEREDAAEKARAANLKRYETEVDLAKRREEIIKRENSLALANGELNDELRQEEADITAERIAAEGELLKVQIENEKTRRELMQDRLEKDLDILIDGFDNVKTINEKIIANDELTLQKRRETLEKTVTLAQDSFNKQIETIRQFTKAQFDENDLLAEQDAVILNQKIRNLGLSEVIEGRLLEIIRERRTALSDLKESYQDLYTTINKLDSLSVDAIIENDEKIKVSKSENVLSAEAGAQKLFDTESALRLKTIEQEQASQEAKAALKQLELENSINTAANIAYTASNLLGQTTTAGKIAAAADAAISGYLGAQKAFTETPGPIFVKLGAAVAAAGFSAKNIAKIFSTDTTIPDVTIPAYATGSENTANTYLAGEVGRELRIDKKGNASLITGPTIFTNDAGNKILSNQETEKILRGDKPSKQINLEPVVNAIRENKAQMNVMLDKFGIISVSKNGSSRTKYLNRKFRNKN